MNFGSFSVASPLVGDEAAAVKWMSIQLENELGKPTAAA